MFGSRFMSSEILGALCLERIDTFGLETHWRNLVCALRLEPFDLSGKAKLTGPSQGCQKSSRSLKCGACLQVFLNVGV